MTECPRCGSELTDREVRSIWASRNSLRRTSYAGGRPPGLRALTAPWDVPVASGKPAAPLTGGAPVKVQRLGARIRRATTENDASYQILDSCQGTRGGTWQAGGCGVLALALLGLIPGSKLVALRNGRTGLIEHLAVQAGGWIMDAAGATPARQFVRSFAARERFDAGMLELVDGDPAQAEGSGIPVDRDRVQVVIRWLRQACRN